jgi:hypothetical protein
MRISDCDSALTNTFPGHESIHSHVSATRPHHSKVSVASRDCDILLIPVCRHFYKGREERYPAVMKTSEFTWANMILFSVVPCEYAHQPVNAELTVENP